MSSVGETTHQVFIFCSTVLWGLYTSLGVQSAAKAFLPEPTRDAAFQLFCDLRTNTPKDLAFAKRHAKALKPHTFTGWLAAGTALLCTAAYTATATALALALTVAALNVLLVISMLGGVTLAVLLGTCSAVLAVGACAAGSAALTCACAYTGAASTKFVVSSTSRLLLGAPLEEPRGTLGGPGAVGALEPVPEEEFHDTQEEAREDLNADAAAAADAAMAKARETLASLQQGGSAAADYAAQKLGLANPGASSTNKKDAVVSPTTPPAEEEAMPVSSSSFMTPTKKRRANPNSSSASDTNSTAPGPDAGADSAASDSTRAADLQAFMDGGWVGSPPASRPPTPERHRPVAAA